MCAVDGRPEPRVGSSVTLREVGLSQNALIEADSKEVRVLENQDVGVGRHTAPPRTTRTNRKSNSKEVRHQVDKKGTYIHTGRRGRDGDRVGGLAWPWWDGDWRSVGLRTGQAV